MEVQYCVNEIGIPSISTYQRDLEEITQADHKLKSELASMRDIVSSTKNVSVGLRNPNTKSFSNRCFFCQKFCLVFISHT